MTQVSFNPNNRSGQANAVCAVKICAEAIRNWMNKDKLLMNDYRTVLLLWWLYTISSVFAGSDIYFSWCSGSFTL